MSSVAQLEAEIKAPRSKWSKSGKENILKNSPKKTKIGKTIPIAYLDLEEQIIHTYQFASESIKK